MGGSEIIFPSRLVRSLQGDPPEFECILIQATLLEDIWHLSAQVFCAVCPHGWEPLHPIRNVVAASHRSERPVDLGNIRQRMRRVRRTGDQKVV